MVLKYYYDMGSQPSRAVYMFMKLNNIPFEEKYISLMTGDNRKPEFKKVSSIQLVPVLDDDGFILTESIAIMKYLIIKYKLAEHWYPRKNLQQQAKLEQYLNWHHVNTRTQSALLFQNLFLIPQRKGTPVNWKKVEFYRNSVKEVVRHLDTFFLRDKPFLNGSEISIADLLAVCELKQLNSVEEENLYECNDNVVKWLHRVEEYVGPMFAECHENIMMVKSMYKMLQESQKESKL